MNTGNVVMTGSLLVTGSTTLNSILVLKTMAFTPTGPSSGSIIVSGSNGTIKPYFWDGNVWNPLY